MVSIYIISDHSVYCKGLQLAIESGLNNATVVQVRCLSKILDIKGCDLILIDSLAVSKASVHLLRAVNQANPGARLAMLSSTNSRADAIRSLSAGFHGFIYKSQSEKELICAINDLLLGRIYISPELIDGTDRLSVYQSTVLYGESARLTPRQCEILPLLAQGLSNKEIALHLRIAQGTAKLHTAALLKAMNARNRTEAAFMAASLVGQAERSNAFSGAQCAKSEISGSEEIRAAVSF